MNKKELTLGLIGITLLSLTVQAIKYTQEKTHTTALLRNSLLVSSTISACDFFVLFVPANLKALLDIFMAQL